MPLSTVPLGTDDAGREEAGLTDSISPLFNKQLDRSCHAVDWCARAYLFQKQAQHFEWQLHSASCIVSVEQLFVQRPKVVPTARTFCFFGTRKKDRSKLAGVYMKSPSQVVTVIWLALTWQPLFSPFVSTTFCMIYIQWCLLVVKVKWYAWMKK